MKFIPNYEGLYSITKCGNVYSHRKNQYLKFDESTGYRRVLLYKDGHKKYSVHKLVALTYIENPNCLGEINHINGNKLDNRVNNLEYVTRSENMIHAYSTGLKESLKGSNHGRSKLKESQINNIRKLLNDGIKQNEIAKMYNVTQQAISLINKNMRWKKE